SRPASDASRSATACLALPNRSGRSAKTSPRRSCPATGSASAPRSSLRIASSTQDTRRRSGISPALRACSRPSREVSTGRSGCSRASRWKYSYPSRSCRAAMNSWAAMMGTATSAFGQAAAAAKPSTSRFCASCGAGLGIEEHAEMPKITPFLWFDTQAEEAAKFYTSIFKNSEIVSVARYGEAGPGPKGSVMTVAFKLDGQDFVALNGGPQFQFTLAISFVVNCKTQEEVDYFWRRLSEGGKTDRCGWLKDKFGLSWQVVPTILGELLQDKNAKKAKSVMEAMLQMDKMEIDK